MLTFTLKTGFTSADLERFYASGTNIVVAKPSGGGAPNVAWIVYRPLIKNEITWEENYGIYASNVDITNGAILTQISQTPFPALSGEIYPFTAAGFFGPSSQGGMENTYSAVNDYNNLPKGYLTMGLFQNANVDGVFLSGSAVSAAPVIYKSTAVMTPFTTVYLWSQSQVKSNTVVTNVTSQMTRVDFSGSVTEVSLQYDPSSGKFILSSGFKLAAGIEIVHPHTLI
jgi:hypothetical protein